MSKRKTQEQFLKEARQKHGDTYNYDRTVYVGIKDHVIITCFYHGDFSQMAEVHLRGNGCPDCANEKLSKLYISRAANKFINEANKKHNNKYIYDLVEYINSETYVKIICPIDGHGIFEQYPYNHLGGQGCPDCGRIKCNETRKLTHEEVIKRFIGVHGNRYDYSLVEYVDIFCPVKIICPIDNHGIFEQDPHHHMSGTGCPECGRKTAALARTISLQEFIDRANLMHNNKYNYDLVILTNIKKKIKIICPKHGIFKQAPGKHMSGDGCPKCAHRISKPETAWLNSLNIDGLQRQYKLKLDGNKKLEFDGFDPITNTAYLFHGDYWHGNPNKYNGSEYNTRAHKTFGELYQITIDKEKIIKDLGYHVVVMWEYDWKKINK